ncbi:MAG: hypothetical protein KTR31_06715 [Myxococcales bacterium]|nr:hypothetical protein [Myxococcales bacterium]
MSRPESPQATPRVEDNGIAAGVAHFETLRDTLRGVEYDEIERQVAHLGSLDPASLTRVVEILGFVPELTHKRNVRLLCRVLQGIKSRQRRLDLI